MNKIFFFLVATITLVFAEEPSAFKAGDLDNPTPYGLTQSEKKIVEQNKNIQSISRNVFDTNQTQIELRNELDGIKSLLGSISEKQNIFSDKLDSDKNGSLKETAIRVDSLTKKLEDNFKLQNENYDKIMATLGEMAKMIDDISQNYVSKEQLKLNLGKNYKDLKAKDIAGSKKSIGKNEENVTESTPQAQARSPEPNPATPDTAKLSNDELYKNAESLYIKNKLPEAKVIFQKLIENKYSKKATVNFYMGEICYKNSEYKEALGYYQDSINFDDKSSFLPLMLYHSAVSLDKLGNKKDAKKVFETLIKTFPKNYLIPSSKKKLSEL